MGKYVFTLCFWGIFCFCAAIQFLLCVWVCNEKKKKSDRFFFNFWNGFTKFKKKCICHFEMLVFFGTSQHCSY